MIKKIITSAALIAAGTALASADTGWTTVIENASVDSGRNTLSELGLTQSYDYDEYSWRVSFTLSGISTTENGGLNTFTTGAYDASEGFAILTNTENGVINIANMNGVHLGDPNSNANATVFDPDGGSLDITLSWDALSYTMTLTVSQDEMDSAYTTTWTPSTEDQYGNTHEDYYVYANLTEDSTFLTHSFDGEATPISNINVSVREVPEPSMFGLLAGLGAIGLVATRRRRNRKA